MLTWQLLTKLPRNLDRFLPEDWDEGYPNVWLGITAEDQLHYDRRWPVLARTPAAVRFISYEPALGELTLREHDERPDWVIWGGESGPGARPMEPGWTRRITKECREMGIPVFAKQWGQDRNNPLVVEEGLTPRDMRERDPHPQGGALLDGELVRQFPREKERR